MPAGVPVDGVRPCEFRQVPAGGSCRWSVVPAGGYQEAKIVAQKVIVKNTFLLTLPVNDGSSQSLSNSVTSQLVSQSLVS
jgi:hypothetical protein